MLVLTRRTGEMVRITVPPSNLPQEIAVCICRTQPGRVRLGFLGEKRIEVARNELIPVEDEARPPVAEAATDITFPHCLRAVRERAAAGG